MMAGSYAKRLKRKQRHQAERLEAILDAACALVTERPISRISTEEIARRAMVIAADICVYTNGNLTVESLKK